MVLLAFTIPIILIAVALSAPALARGNRVLNSLTVGHAAVCLAASLWLLAGTQLPQYFLADSYLFIDTFSAYEAAIASLVFLVAALFARGYIKVLLRTRQLDRENIRLFYGAFNFLLVIVVFAFFANNLALFWILVELTTILSAMLIVTLNARENVLAALKYVFIASTAMLFSFIGIILVFAMTRQALGAGTLNWSDLVVQARVLPAPLLTLAFVLMFIGFASKSGIVPFHTWLPPAHAKAPSVISALLSAVLLNIGIYGIIRIYAVARQTEAVHAISLVLIVFGVLTIGVAAFSMLARENIKKLIAFSSIEHMGLLLVGIGLGSPIALFWVLFHTLGHALVKSLMFLSSGILHAQFESNKVYDMKNVLALQPLASAGLILGAVAIVGTPIFPLFFSKFYILSQLGRFSLPALFLVLLLLLVAAAATAVFLVRAFSQNEPEGKPEKHYPVS